MSAAAAAAPPPPPPASRRQHSYNTPSAERHQRTASLTRPPTSASEAYRSEPLAGPSRGPVAPHQQSLAGVARRDHEHTNLAKPPPSARRSLSRDPVPSPTQRNDPVRSTHRNDSRSGHQRYASDGSRVAASAPAPALPASVASEQGRTASHDPSTPVKKRTMIQAQTGSWSLGKTIGAGSMGKVKLARNTETGEQCAIKIVPRQSTDEHHSARDRERADQSKDIRTAREAAIVSLLSHPYVCGLRDVVRTTYHWYMIFEYVNGGQMLDYIISHGRLKEKQARKFGRQIASALDYCHRNSIVHRDLKIENILISKTGDIKIIDFGLSNLFSPKSLLKTFCGSLYFAAPELLQARQYPGPEVDVWSFGIVLYVLVCGKVPFDDQSMPQLHAKIKRGVVDYPAWLTAECKHLISRMLVTDPKQRASLGEIIAHPWMTKGFNAPPENYLPHREPIQLPLDQAILDKMTGFDFGPSEYIKRELTRVIESEEYQTAVRLSSKETIAAATSSEKKRGVFDFYKRRNSTTSRDTLPNVSTEAVHPGADPVNAFSPLLSIYYLVKEKQERERLEANPGALEMPRSPGEEPIKIADLPAPQAAYTNSNTYEQPGEKATGGRSRPRARTHGEDEIPNGVKQLQIGTTSTPKSPSIVTTPAPPTSAKKESMAGGLLRRFSTRRGRDGQQRPKETTETNSPQLKVPTDITAAPKRGYSVRRPCDKDAPMLHSAGSQPQQGGLLSPPLSGSAFSRASGKILGRSTSVNSGDLRRRKALERNASEALPDPSTGDIPLTSGSEHSSTAGPKVKLVEPSPVVPKPTPRTSSPASRTKSVDPARHESIQARRARRNGSRQSNIPEGTVRDVNPDDLTDAGESQSEMKPVFLKGLFSVSTTSSKPLPIIRADIIRALKQLGVEYTEIKGGFRCQHVPSIDLASVIDPHKSSPDPQSMASPSHRRRISFAGFRSGDREKELPRDLERSPRPAQRHVRPDASFTGSEDSMEEEVRRGQSGRAAGETTTHVESDLGENLVLRFEIFVVKVPLFSLHGIQFKKVAGGTWFYKSMAQKILDALRL